jgi:hypothetical protein
MSKHTKIEKLEGDPVLDNHYCLYSGVDLVGNAVPFSVLAAAETMLEALMDARFTIKGFFEGREVEALLKR